MTIESWMAAVGGSWRRLLLYPGGLTAVSLALALALLWRLGTPRPPRRLSSSLSPWWSIPALSAPLLVLGVLPLPSPSELRVPLDLPALLLLLETPLIIATVNGLRNPDPEQQTAVGIYLAGLLTVAPILALVLAALATGTGTLVMAAPPAPGAETLAAAVCWALALPPLLQLGPWRTTPPSAIGLWLALQLRRAGHLALASLPWLARWPEQLPAPLSVSAIKDQTIFFATVFLLALLLLVFDRLARGGDMRRWAYLYFPLGLLLGIVLLMRGAVMLAERLS